MNLIGISPEYERQIRKTVRAYLSKHWDIMEAIGRLSRLPTRFREHAVILDEAMAGVDFLDEPTGSTDPGKPNATICRWDTELKTYIQTEDRLAVANHSNTDYAIDTPGAAIAVDGHYWFFGACDAMTSRPAPPWREDFDG